MTLADDILADDFESIAARTKRRFDVDVTPSDTKKLLKGFPKNMLRGGGSWSEGTIWMWVKNRIQFKIGRSVNDDTYVSVGTLHFFFTGIEETQLMLDKLHNDPASSKKIDEVRSRLFRWLETKDIRPVNRVAWLVSALRQ